MRRHTPGLLVCIVLLVAACGAGTQAPTTTQSDPPVQQAAAQPVVLAAQDIKFDRADLQGTVGQPLTVEFTNEGVLPHDFTIDQIPLQEADGHVDAAAEDDHEDEAAEDVHDDEAAGDDHNDGADHNEDSAVHLHLEAGENGATTFIPAEPGTYTYYCSVEGHREAGMEGTLLVSDPAS